MQREEELLRELHEVRRREWERERGLMGGDFRGDGREWVRDEKCECFFFMPVCFPPPPWARIFFFLVERWIVVGLIAVYRL